MQERKHGPNTKPHYHITWNRFHITWNRIHKHHKQHTQPQLLPRSTTQSNDAIQSRWLSVSSQLGVNNLPRVVTPTAIELLIVCRLSPTIREVSGRFGGLDPKPLIMDNILPWYCLNCTKLGNLILGKIIKIVANKCHILKLKCTKFDFGWGSGPDPLGELTALSQTP